MKKILLLIICSLLSVGTFAQKFGHINSAELLSLMPERTTAESTLQDYAQGLEAQLMSMQSEYQASIEDYQNNESNYDNLTKQDKIAEIQGLEQRIATFQQSATASLQNKEQELLDPMLQKAQEAIDKVAKNGKYTYIFDSSTGVLLYVNDSEDILPKVKKELGL